MNAHPMLHHNNPPGPIEAGKDTAVAISAWLAEHPEIANEDHAKDAKLLLDRARSSAGEVEDARKAETKPLNDRLDEINARYKYIHNTDKKHPGILDKTVARLSELVTDWLAKQEAARFMAAEDARKEAEAKTEAARLAAVAEQEAIDNARAGELGVDVTQVVITADRAAKDAALAERVAARAERELEHNRLAGGWHNSVGLKDKETLVLESYGKAITAIGPHPKIEAAVISAAREYRKARGVLPDGVTAKTERRI